MKPASRLQPLFGVGQVFEMPTLVTALGLLASLGIAAASLLDESVRGYFLPGLGLAVVFFLILVFLLFIPLLRAIQLRQDGQQASALVLKTEKRSRLLIESNTTNILVDDYAVLEFTPQGANQPTQIDTWVGRVARKVKEGKTVKITYSLSNPRIFKIDGE